MAKTVTINDSELQGIVINNVKESGVHTGYSCSISYLMTDDAGKPVLSSSSSKYTSGTSYPAESKLSGESETLVTDFISALMVKMKSKEGI